MVTAVVSLIGNETVEQGDLILRVGQAVHMIPCSSLCLVKNYISNICLIFNL